MNKETNQPIIQEFPKQMSRREFIKLFPKLLKGISITNLASFFGITIIGDETNNLTSRRVIENLGITALEEDKKLIKQVTDLASYYRGQVLKQTQPGPGSIEFRNLEMYQESIDDTQRLKELKNLRNKYSVYADEINPVVRKAIPGHLIDFDSIPQVKEIRKIKDVHERVLQMVKLLAVQTKGDLLRNFREMNQSNVLLKLCVLRDNLNLLIGNYDSLKNQGNSQLPSIDILRNLLAKVSKNIEKIQDSFMDYDPKMGSNPAWSDKLSCNLYASTLIAALGLGHRLSHRVDEQGRPVKKGGRELSAEDTFNWLNKYGKKYGWVNVSNLNYSEKVEMLRNGYIFYGAHPGHNWIVTGVSLNNEIQPALTQATNHTLIKLFNTSNLIKSIVESYSGFLLDTREQEILTQEDYYYGANFKLMPYGHGEEELWAIHIDESKNPPLPR